MKKFIKNLVLFFFIIVIIAGIGVGIYYYSPEVKPGEVGLLYKTVGKDRGFTGKVLTPGKYYCFITEFNPFINKIYNFKLNAESIDITNDYPPGVSVNYSVMFDVNPQRVGDFVKRVKKNEEKKIVRLYLDSAFKLELLKLKINKIFSKDFYDKTVKNIQSSVNRDLDYFGLSVIKIDIKSIKPDAQLRALYEKAKKTEEELAEMQLQMEKKLKQEEFNNKLKEKQLQYLLKKAEAENTITKLKTESMKLLREEDKKRMIEEVDIFSKPGGDLAAKLEAIRVLSQSVKNPGKILDKVNEVFQK